MKRYLLFIAVSIGSGCVATDVGNPQTDEETNAEIHVQAYEEETPSALTLDDELTITHAWMAIDETRLEACDDDESSGESESESEESESEEEGEFEERQRGIIVTDLISGTSFPHPIRLGQAGMVFCSLRLDIRPVGADEAPAGTPSDLRGYSMLVRGHRKDGTPFIVRGGFNEEVELEGEIELMPDAVDSLLLGFAANTWLSQRELGSLVGDVIEIDRESNAEVYRRFVESVPESARLFADDGDGRLQPEESNSPLALPSN